MKYSDLNQEQKAMVDKAVALYERCDNTYKWIVTRCLLTKEQAQTLLHAVINECRVDSSIQVLSLQRVGLKTIIEVMDLIREKIV